MAAVADQVFPSPLRYPGGKGRLAGYIKLVLLENDLVGCEYVEPYAGGGSVALSLLFEEYASHVHINDLDPAVHAFWSAVLNHTDELCERIVTTPVTVEEWHRQKALQDQPAASTIDLGFSTFFLNRTARSGIIGGGIIGGRDQRGKWKIDARFGRDDLVRRVRRVARFRSRITLTGVDAAEYLKTQLLGIPDAFIYLDPPYYVKGQGLYRNSYTHEDHAEVARLVRALKNPWLVSYDAHDAIEALYADTPTVRYGLSYSAQSRYRGQELMFSSARLRLPLVVSPACVPAKHVDAVRVSALKRTPGAETAGARELAPRTEEAPGSPFGG